MIYRRPYGSLIQSHLFSKRRLSPWSLEHGPENQIKGDLDVYDDQQKAMDGDDLYTIDRSTPPCGRVAATCSAEMVELLANQDSHHKLGTAWTGETVNRNDALLIRTSNFIRKVASGGSILPKDLLRSVTKIIAEQTQSVRFSSSFRNDAVDGQQVKTSAKRSKFTVIRQYMFVCLCVTQDILHS
jgi:hypothetical protein